MDRVLGGFFRRFNRLFHRGSDAYSGGVQRVIGRKALMLVIYAVLGATWGCSSWCPAACAGPGQAVPVGFAQLPDGATLDRTEDVIRRMGEIVKQNPAWKTPSPSRACPSTASPTAPTRASSLSRSSPLPSASAPTRAAAPSGQLNQAFGHPGSLHRHVPAAAGGRPGHDRRLQAADRGPRLAGL
jgi:multidrug efflux pump